MPLNGKIDKTFFFVRDFTESNSSVKMKRIKIEEHQLCYQISFYIIFVQPNVFAVEYCKVMLLRGKNVEILFFAHNFTGSASSVKTKMNKIEKHNIYNQPAFLLFCFDYPWEW